MSTISYDTLLTLKMRNTFYMNLNCSKDLEVFPTKQTAAEIQNRKLLFRNDTEGFRILYRTSTGATPLVPLSNTRLVFGFNLANAGFLNFTDLDSNTAIYVNGKIPFFKNTVAATDDLSYELLDFLRPEVFTYEFPQTTAGTGHIRIWNEANENVTPALPDPDLIAPDPSNRYYYPVNLTGLPPGRYTFETWLIPGQEITKTVYISQELCGKGAFGIVQIDIPLSIATIPDQYNMNFTARVSQWKYYVVLKSAVAVIGDIIGIADQGGTPPPGDPYGVLTFNASTNGSVDGVDAKVITSFRTDIPFVDVPKTMLSVVKNPGPGAITLVQNISSVAPDKISAVAGSPGITEIVVYI